MDDENLIQEIFEMEARGILSDLAVSPRLIGMFWFMDEEGQQKAIKHIVSILNECHHLGHLQTLILSDEERQSLCGYALLFSLPLPEAPKYLQKIYLKEEFRGGGLGSLLLNQLKEAEPNITLLSSSKNIKFYEKNGFQLLGDFTVPKNDNFSFSQGLYSDLYVMSTHSESQAAPIFLINDDDIKHILSLIGSSASGN